MIEKNMVVEAAGDERLHVHEDYEFNFHSRRRWAPTTKSHITLEGEGETLCGRVIRGGLNYSYDTEAFRQRVCKVCWKAYETKVKPALDLRSALE